MTKLNRSIIAANLKDARKELEKIEKLVAVEDPDEVELLLMLEHAYHHLNFAWNARAASTGQYANLTAEEFNRWGKYPKEISSLAVPLKRGVNKKAGPDKPRKNAAVKKRRSL